MNTPTLSRRLYPALACFLIIGPILAAAPDTQWTVLSASGSVEFTRDQAAGLAWETLVRGARLPGAAALRTGADGRATLALGRSLILVDPDSRLELPSRSSPLRPLRVYQASGSANYDIHKGRRQRFQVITPYLVAGVKGTVFRVQVGEKSSSVLVTQGVVEVFSLRGDLGVDVHAGQQVHLDALPGAIPRLAPAPSEDRERLDLVSRIGRDQYQEARRNGTFAKPEPGWVMVNGFLDRDDGSADVISTREDLSENGDDLLADDKDGSLLDDDTELTRELEKEESLLEEERIEKFQDPAKGASASDPQASGTSR
ncbi:MAG: FecR family protein [Acidobacteria bacterium]|nr:FecR family protein [Acidobacteriota bacterium]